MLTITQSDNALIVQGQANGLYPDNGTNSYPLNSISLVVDESDIATFRSAATNDVLFSGRIEEITIGGEAVTKDTIFAKFDAVANSSGGGGGDVDLTNYYTKTQTDDKFATKTELSEVSQSAMNAAETAQTTANTAKTTAETAQSTANEAKSTAESKQDALVSGENIKTVNGESLLGEGNIQIEEPDLTDYYTKDEADGKYATKTDLSSTADSLQTAVGVAQGAAEDAQDEAMAAKTLAQSKQDKLVSGGNIKTVNGESLLGEGNIVIQGGGGGDVDLSDYYTKEEADAKYATMEEMNDAAADISALEADMTQKQAKLVSGTNIKTVNGSTLLGSGNVTIPVMTDDERQKLYDAADGETYQALFFSTPAFGLKAGAYYFEPYKRSIEIADNIELTAYNTELSVWQQYFMKVSWGVPWNGNGFDGWFPVQMGYFYGGEVEFGGLKMTTTFGESGMGMGLTQKKSWITLSVVDSNGAAAQAYSDCRIFVNMNQVKGIYETSSVTFQSGDIVTFLNENGGSAAPSISASMTQDNLSSGIFKISYCFKNLSANPEPFYGYDMEWHKVVFSGGGGGDADLTNYYTKTQVDTKLTNKQDKLVSGKNIKTINYNSIVGSGNLSISTGMLKDDADKAYLPMGFPPSDVRSCRYTIDTDTVPTIYGAEHEYDFEGLFYAPLKGTQTTYISSDNDPDFQNKVFRISKQSINNIDWTLAYPFMLGAPDSSSSTYGADNSYGVSFLWDRATGMWKFFLNNTNGTMANRLKYATVFINGVPIRGQYSFIDLNDTNKLYPVYIRPGDVVAIFNESSSVTNGQAVFSYGVSDSSKYAVIYQVAGNNPNPLFSRQNGVKKYLADEWTGTADEYAALETKDENTTYFVTE